MDLLGPIRLAPNAERGTAPASALDPAALLIGGRRGGGIVAIMRERLMEKGLQTT